jgi:3-hydroxyacyl-CoA dehydrogenase
MSSAAPVESPQKRFDAQPLLVRRAAVLGAGTMGSRIAAHLANAGIPTLLLDLPPKSQGSESLARTAIESLLKAKPAAFYEPSLAALITPGTFDDDLEKLAGCDWVIEAVAENLEIKTALLARVVPHLAPHAVLTTNTSGLPIGQIGAVLTSHRDRFFGTHFFNPPRYMRLLEIIPTQESDAGVVAAFAAFAGRMLGKQVVYANDTPNFIANRLGIALTFTAGNLMMSGGFGIEEVDTLTGPVIGWPRTGIFRLADLVGIDILAHVARNFPEGVTKGPFSALLEEMIERGWLGDKAGAPGDGSSSTGWKAGQGFYKKVKGADGKDERLVLDPISFEYRTMEKITLPMLEMAKTTESLASRLRILLKHDPATERGASFLWPVLASLWQNAADAIGVAAADIPSLDAAMRAGYNWEMGPFEMWDAVFVDYSVGRMRSWGLYIPPAVEALLATGESSWYANDGRACFQPATGKFERVATIAGQARVLDFRRELKWVRGNNGASLIDIGEGIGCIELHSLKNAIGEDVVQAIRSIVDPGSESVRDFAGFVISGDRENFSVGANLMQILLAAQEGEWDELAAMIAGFQKMTSAIKFCPRPVVAAPFGMTLGGGAEICLAACRRQPHAELYMGLVEAGVGLIPAGGGTKEMLLHALDEATALAQPDPKDPSSRFAQSAELATTLKQRLEVMAMARVSTSAADARSMGLLRADDRVTLNRDRLLLDAKAQVATLAANGYMPPQPRTGIPAAGIAALATLETGIFMMGEAGYASEHDQKVARWLAYILCGGRVTPGTPVSEEYILELEREAFLSLLGERKTQQRITYTLKTGKPMRN